MRVFSLELRNFRNIRQASLLPSPGLNLITGSNAQGKTSILEALGILATLRSFRRAKPVELIQHGEPFSDIQCKVVAELPEGEPWTSELKIVMARKGDSATRVALIDQKTSPSSTYYLSRRTQSTGGGFHAVTFNPSDHELVRGEPRLRREYLNQVIAAEETEYLVALKRYQKLLEQRNAILRTADFRFKSSLETFSEAFDVEAARVTFFRLHWLKKLQLEINATLYRISKKQLPISLFYDCEWLDKNNEFNFNNNNLNEKYFSGQGDVPPLEELKKEFRNRRLALGSSEWFAKSSLLGPHRDDLRINLGEYLLKTKGSQGEVRSTLLALKLCEIELFSRRTGLKPVLLLDDFSSELDRSRRESLLQFVSECGLQVFVTATEVAKEQVLTAGRHFEIHAGEIQSGWQQEWLLTST